MELVAIIIIIGLVLWVEMLIYDKYALKGIRYYAKVNKTEVYEGDTVELTEIVENRSALPLPWIKTELAASKWLAFYRKDSAAQTVGGDVNFIPGVFSLKAKNRCVRTRRIKCLKRGVYTFENTSINGTDIMGLVNNSFTVPVNITITVLPTASEKKDAILSFNEPIGEIMVRRFINEDPFMISGSKEYSGREPLNRINWGYTAIHNKLMVFNNEYSTSRNVLVVMNMQRAGVFPITCASMGDIEAFIKLTVAVLYDCNKQGCKCAFATNGSKASGVASDIIVTAEQYESALRLLADIEESCVTEFTEYCSNINFGLFTDVYFITSYIDEGIIAIADKMKSAGVNAVFYTTGDVPDDIDYCCIHTRKFSYRINNDNLKEGI